MTMEKNIPNWEKIYNDMISPPKPINGAAIKNRLMNSYNETVKKDGFT
ncbi:MAG: hypothetical protein Q4D45_13005 [Lachnospiraceae bacterium]|nr:hypothetical protein [Lachnospiraceae bacterium]